MPYRVVLVDTATNATSNVTDMDITGSLKIDGITTLTGQCDGVDDAEVSLSDLTAKFNKLLENLRAIKLLSGAAGDASSSSSSSYSSDSSISSSSSTSSSSSYINNWSSSSSSSYTEHVTGNSSDTWTGGYNCNGLWLWNGSEYIKDGMHLFYSAGLSQWYICLIGNDESKPMYKVVVGSGDRPPIYGSGWLRNTNYPDPDTIPSGMESCSFFTTSL